MDLRDMRISYGRDELDEKASAADPTEQFAAWFQQAQDADVTEPNAMTLATVGEDGRPSARTVLVKSFDADGVVFFTNYDSRKGQELAANPFAALLFFWAAQERQVRIEGRVEKVSAAESDEYFAMRPLGSRIGAWASPQSQVIESRQVIVDNEKAAAERFGDDPPRPEHWGGYRLVPDRWEFWQGRASRLHDRLQYTLDDQGNWTRDRLAP